MLCYVMMHAVRVGGIITELMTDHTHGHTYIEKNNNNVFCFYRGHFT